MGQAEPTPASVLSAIALTAKSGPYMRRTKDVVNGSEGIRELIYRPKPQAEVLDINSIVEDVMSLIEADARIEGASDGRLHEASAPRVRGDALHLHAVLLSLARNSFEAMRDGSRQERRILIRTSLDDKGRVRVSVSDRGPGVAAPLEGRIFDPFVTTNRKRLGIGLSISHSVVKAHEGGLTYERNSEGESTFVVDLPPCDAEAPQ